MTDVIEAASVKVGTMADGTLRITLDIEPMNAQAAFALFGSPGTPIALAALKAGFAAHGLATNPVVAHKEPNVSDKPKGGELAKLAGQWSKDPNFWRWASKTNPPKWDIRTEEEAAAYFYETCEVDSRADLDHDKVAAERFQALIRGPYMRYTGNK